MKIWIDVAVSDPPLKRFLDVLYRFLQIVFKLASPRTDVICHRDVRKGGEVIVVSL